MNAPLPLGWSAPSPAPAPVKRAGNPAWTTGVSGNPSGRPKSVGEVRRLAREQTVAAIETLVEIARDPNQPGSARVAACNVLLDRGYGKAVQQVEVGGPGQFDSFDYDELKQHVIKHARRIVIEGIANP